MLSKQVNEKNKIDNLKDLKAIFNSLHNIFHWIPGERILNPEFGSNIHSLLYNGITEFNKEQIAAEIQQSISKWEPRVSIVKIVDMTDINDTENNTIRLDVIFTVPSLNNNE
jgi:phage baseplate assembly protein W